MEEYLDKKSNEDSCHEDSSLRNHSLISQNYISTTFVYVNSDNSIDKVISETHPLVEMTLSYSQILHFIQSKKNTPTAKYKLIDILRYCVEIDPSGIEQYAYADMSSLQEMSKPFFKIMPIYESVPFPPSMSVFHRVNSLYFIFKEKMRIPPKSILKSNPISENEHVKKTKKNDYKNRAHTKRVNFV